MAVQERSMAAFQRLASAHAWSTTASVRPACREPRAPAGFVLRICGVRARPLASAGNGRRGRRANDRVSASIWWLIVTNRSDGNAARTQRSRLAAAPQPTGVCASSHVASKRRAVSTRHPRPCMMSARPQGVSSPCGRGPRPASSSRRRSGRSGPRGSVNRPRGKPLGAPGATHAPAPRLRLMATMPPRFPQGEPVATEDDGGAHVAA